MNDSPPEYEAPAAEEIQADGDPAETCAAIGTLAE